MGWDEGVAWAFQRQDTCTRSSTMPDASVVRASATQCSTDPWFCRAADRRFCESCDGCMQAVCLPVHERLRQWCGVSVLSSLCARREEAAPEREERADEREEELSNIVSFGTLTAHL